MPSVHLSFYNEEKTFHTPTWGRFSIRPYQILAYISITGRNASSCSDAHIFPAIVDTGCGYCLTMHEKQFEAAQTWGSVFKPMQGLKTIRGFNGLLSTGQPFRGDAWIHDYTPKTVPENHRAPEASNKKPIKLFFAQEGIICYGYSDDNENEAGNQSVFRKIRSFFAPLTSTVKSPPDIVAAKMRDGNSDRLSHPHLPLLGLRSLCINYVSAEIVCTPTGGTVKLTQQVDGAPNNYSI